MDVCGTSVANNKETVQEMHNNSDDKSNDSAVFSWESH